MANPKELEMKHHSPTIKLTRKDNGKKIYVTKETLVLIEDGVDGGALVYCGHMTRQVTETPAEVNQLLHC